MPYNKFCKEEPSIRYLVSEFLKIHRIPERFEFPYKEWIKSIAWHCNTSEEIVMQELMELKKAE